MERTLSLKIPSILENVRIIESFLDHAKDKFQFNDDIYGNILVAVTESVNNAIVHGNKEDKNKNVHLELNIEDGLLRFSVEDEGAGFDYTQLPDPTSPEYLETLGGRGIYLIRHLADEVKFADQGRKVALIFYMNA
jgi:serine/threonine-protein kinase RsbW